MLGVLEVRDLAESRHVIKYTTLYLVFIFSNERLELPIYQDCSSSIHVALASLAGRIPS